MDPHCPENLTKYAHVALISIDRGFEISAHLDPDGGILPRLAECRNPHRNSAIVKILTASSSSAPAQRDMTEPFNPELVAIRAINPRKHGWGLGWLLVLRTDFRTDVITRRENDVWHAIVHITTLRHSVQVDDNAVIGMLGDASRKALR